MRIRKNKGLSSLLMFSHASGPGDASPSHVCQLNQSPWDAIQFSSSSSFPSQLLHYQWEVEDSLNGNESLADSINGVESFVVSIKEEEEYEAGAAAEATKIEIDDGMVIEDNYRNDNKKKSFADEDVFDNNIEEKMSCENDKKRSFDDDEGEEETKNEIKFKKGEVKSWHCNNNKPAADRSGARRGGRGKGSKKGTTSSSTTASSINPYEFYYYSGFGPRWGKRRGDRCVEAFNSNEHSASENGCAAASSSVAVNDTTHSSTTSSLIDHGRLLDYLDDDDDDEEGEEEDENGGDSGKKRMRKPVKARSLKSLM